MKMINLLPDVKRVRLQQKRQEQLVRGIAASTIIVMVVLVIIFSSAVIIQNRRLVSTQSRIAEEQTAINAIENKDVLVGMQTALDKLPELDRQRILISQLPGILEQVVPANVTVTNMEYFTDGSFELTGETNAYRNIYTFVDAMEKVQRVPAGGDESDGVYYFTGVELTGSSPGTIINFTLRATFNTLVLLPEQGGGLEE